MGIIDFVALTFAASGWVDAWFNGSIFDEWRAYFEARDDGSMLAEPYRSSRNISASLSHPNADNPSLWTRLWIWLFDLLPNWFCELVSCKFCFSHHTPWALATLFFVPALFVPAPWSFLLKLPVYSLAATRIGNIINAYVPMDARYDRGTEVFIEEDYDEPKRPTSPDEPDTSSGP